MNVGQFEEFASLQQAMGRSLRTERILTAASPREEAHETEEEEETDSKPTNCQESEQVPKTTSPTTKTMQKKNPSLLVQMIPEELIHKVMSFLSVDSYLTTWSILCKSFCDLSNNELTFKIICQRIYTQQTKSKKLDLKRYNSYRTMYINRPRVRTGGGIYVLKYSQIKRIQRDMWTEVPLGATLETVYYRYLYFCENGTVLYALTPMEPQDIIPKLLLKLKGNDNSNNKENNNRIVSGKYEVCKNVARVFDIKYSWCHVVFDLQICTEKEEEKEEEVDNTLFTQLFLVKHQTRTSRTPFNGDLLDDTATNYDVTEFQTPSEPFRFLFDNRL